MSSETIYSIYLITNLVNDKKYVGWTSRDPLVRFKEHKSSREPKTQERSAISYAIEKYGTDNFNFQILYQSKDYDHCRDIETFFITENESLVDQWGYNKDLGGTGHKRSQETIEKHRQQISGRKQSEEHKKKRADAVRGVKNGMFGKTGENHPGYGSTHSDESKEKMSISQKRAIEKRKADGTYVAPIMTEESIEKMRQTKLNNRSTKSKFVNIVIEDPDGNVIELDSNYMDYFKDRALNNFMSKQTKDNSKPIKGYRLISYELR